MNFFYSEKIIAFELDFFQLQTDYEYSELNRLFDLFSEIGIHNNLFLFTNNSLQTALNLVKQYDLKLAYLISNSGACVYNLVKDKKEEEKFLDRTITKLILRFSFFNNLFFIIHCSNFQSFIFGYDYLSQERQEFYESYFKLKNLKEIQKVIKENSIYSLEIFFEEDIEIRGTKIRSFLFKLLEFQDKINHLVVDPIIYIFSKDNSKQQIISEIMDIREEELNTNLMYVSWATPDISLASSAFFWLSFEKFESFISAYVSNNLVLYLNKDFEIWMNWWMTHDYMWKEKIFKLDWIARKIKKSEILNLNYFKNCFELNLSNGLLQNKALNQKWNTWEVLQKRIFGDMKEDRMTLFLWSEQLENLLTFSRFRN